MNFLDCSGLGFNDQVLTPPYYKQDDPLIFPALKFHCATLIKWP